METHKTAPDDSADYYGSGIKHKRVKFMETIEKCTEALIQAIQESKEYVRFCQVRDAVRMEPGLRQEINDFRRHVFAVQNAQEPLDMYGEQERLCRDYEEFRKNALVHEFLESELRVCRILQRIMADVAGVVDLDEQEVI